MNPEQPDRELDEHLAGRSAVSRLYEQVASEEPSPELDARIRQAARQQIARYKSRWLIPVSTAAAVLLAFGVLLQLQHEGISVLPQGTIPTMPEDKEATAPVAAPGSVPPPATEYSSESAAPADSWQVIAPVPQAEKRAEPFPGDNARMTGPPVTAPIPSDPTNESSKVERVEDVFESAPREEVAPAAANGAAPAPAPQADGRADALTPKERLARIRELRVLGRDQQADEELATFRKQYPDYPIPADIN